MARLKLPLKPTAVYGVVKELRLAARDERPLVVAGAPEPAGALRRELVRGGNEWAVREGGTLGEAAAVIYVVAGTASEADERELRAASERSVPLVCVVVAPVLDGDVPHVPDADVIQARPGAPFPVDEIARSLARKLGEEATPLAAQLPVLRRAVAEELIRKFARQNGVLGAAVFIPGADLPALTLNQLRLVLRIASTYGFPVERERIPEALAVVASGFGFRAVARQALSFVPVAGWAVKGGVAYAGTRALGEAAVRYFAARAEERERAASAVRPDS